MLRMADAQCQQPTGFSPACKGAQKSVKDPASEQRQKDREGCHVNASDEFCRVRPLDFGVEGPLDFGVEE